MDVAPGKGSGASIRGRETRRYHLERTATIERGLETCGAGAGSSATARIGAGGDAGASAPGGKHWDEQYWDGLSDLEPALRKLLLQRCGDENDVDDVIQETYLRAARYRNSVADPRSLPAWTARIALNVLNDQRRQSKRWQSLPGGEEGLDATLPEVLVSEEDESSVCLGRFILPTEDALGLMVRALGSLRESDQRLLQAFYQDGLDVPGCARRLSIQPKLVKVRLYRARHRMLRRAEILLAEFRPCALMKGRIADGATLQVGA